MATVFMKWLERSPEKYDKGIQLLTLGRLKVLRRLILEQYIEGGIQVLEIGCGTGGLAFQMAEKGAKIAAVDSSNVMLAEAAKKAPHLDTDCTLDFLQLDATQIGDHFAPGTFDLIVASLVFSELTTRQTHFVLNHCALLLKPAGKLLVVDEIEPERWAGRLFYWMVRIPLLLLTWLLTRTYTNPLKGFERTLRQSGFSSSVPASHLWGSLVLFEGMPAPMRPDMPFSGEITGYLEHKPSLRTVLMDILLLFFRIVPPYPKVLPGLYAVGRPDKNSAVLVTGNFDLTVRRVVKAVSGEVDVWLMVVDSGGINVWCAAGGGYFTAEKVISALNSCGLSEVVAHRALILPQLAANGVDGWKIREASGWGVHWGPTQACDIPAYLSSGRKKTEMMRRVPFGLKARLEMGVVVNGFYVLMLAIPFWFIWRSHFWLLLLLTGSLSLLYSVFLPWIPGKDGIGKGTFLAGVTLFGFWCWVWVFGGWHFENLWNWSLGLGFLAFFVGAEFQGMSPHMRGEQANWGIEGLVGLGILAGFLAPRFLGVW